MLSNNGLCLRSMRSYVLLIFSTGSKLQLVEILHSYTLLLKAPVSIYFYIWQ